MVLRIIEEFNLKKKNQWFKLALKINFKAIKKFTLSSWCIKIKILISGIKRILNCCTYIGNRKISSSSEMTWNYSVVCICFGVFYVWQWQLINIIYNSNNNRSLNVLILLFWCLPKNDALQSQKILQHYYFSLILMKCIFTLALRRAHKLKSRVSHFNLTQMYSLKNAR